MAITDFLTFTPASAMKAPVQYLDLSQFYTHFGSTAEGQYNNSSVEQITSNNFTNVRDVVYGNGGYDYISTGGGDDKVVVGDNNGTWRGSGNEFGNATIVDTGANNDDIIVDAKKGAFNLTIGEGQDDVIIKGGDYIKINAYDGDFSADTFKFTTDFHGRAEISGIDHTDFLTLQGGDWHQTAMNGNLAFYNDHGGTVELMGTSADYAPTQPHWDL